MNKITIIGDIICDKEMLKHAKVKKEYNFDEMFSPLNKYFKNSDYVIANLETVISKQNYTKDVFSFNNPESLLITLKKIGVSAVSLANNHILDRGKTGVEDTILALEKHKIKYFGVNRKKLYINLKDCKVCLLGYTDSTNYHVNKYIYEENINMLKPQNIKIIRPKNNIIKNIYYKLNPNIRININNFFKIKIKPIIDKISPYDELEKYMKPLKEDIKSAFKKGYYTIIYPHMGGQYNIEPGNYTTKMVNKFIKYGCNSVVITHPHIIQKKKYINNSPCFYSIGGLIISPTSKFVLWNTHPEYSLAIHYYYEKMQLKKITCSFLICVKDKKSYLKIYPFYDYYNSLRKEQQQKVYRTFTEIYKRLFPSNLKNIKIKKEYLIKEEL